MTKLGKLWTGAVAYVSLLVGAGLSVAGNLADTYRTRGADVDNLDRVMAAGWPILVLLAIEMFVSPRWSPRRMFQVWRWVGCLAVGGMAMVVSWTHLHDLMTARSQLPVVAIVGPLAIDGMAIMATGLILSTRVRMTADTAATDEHATAVTADTTATDERTTADTVVSAVMDAPSPDRDGHPVGHDRWGDLVRGVESGVHADMTPMSINDLNDWVAGQERAHADIADALATEAQQHLAAVTADTLPQRIRATRSVPQEFADMVAAWDPAQLDRADLVELTAAWFGKSPRTARRWLAAALNEPISSPPEKS